MADVQASPGVPAGQNVFVAEPTGGLLVEHDHAELYYNGDAYRLTQRRRLINHSDQLITRYLIRISVDRYPGDPERSNKLYRDNPLTWDEINLHAWHGDDRAEPMQWSVQHDRDAFKEVWLLFANDNGHFPLYPGEDTWIEYTYTIGDDKWGNWFRRAIRLPTKHLSVRLDFPADLDPAAWGLHTSMTAESMPFQTAIHTQESGDRRIYSWSIEDPPLHARYRLEWHFRNQPNEAHPKTPKPGAMMKALGIVQDGDPVLRRPARSFALPTVTRRITIFDRGIARLVAHEVDHLHGILCRDHLRDGVAPVPVEQYRGTGTSWHYPATMINPS